MKRTILTAMLIGCGITASSAMQSGEDIGNYAPKKEKIDTLSYIAGIQIGQNIKNEILPQLKLDYGIIFSTIDKNFAKDKPIKVENETLTPDNLKEVSKKYFDAEFRKRIQASANDSTVEIFSPTDRKIVSTLIGADFAYRMKDAPHPIEKKSLLKGIADTQEEKEIITIQEANKYMQNYFSTVLPEKNRKESEAWLAKIEKQKGVKKTDSGILYKIEATGDMNAKAVKNDDVVKVLYTGTTISGKVFDSNKWSDMPQARKEYIKASTPDAAEKDNPIEFPLNRVIKGWTEGMKLIGKGGRITLWIPSGLAYGERGTGQDIGPNQALRFDVELLDVTVK